MLDFKGFVNRGRNRVRKEAGLMIISFIIAILVWFLISVMIYPSLTETFENVPLQQIDLSNTPAEELGLSVAVSQDIASVDIRIEGSRAKIGNLGADQIVARIDTSSVTTVGTHILPIIVESKNNTDFNVLLIEPSSIEVEFDKVTEKTFTVTMDDSNISASDGYYCSREEITWEPSTVTIAGFESELSRINTVTIRPELSETLTESTEITTSNILLFTADGALKDMTTSGLNIKNDKFNVTVPIYIERTLSITPTISNLSTAYYFDSSIFGDPSLCTIEPSSISVISSSATINNYDTIGTEAISLLEIQPGYSVKVKVDIPDGCKNVSGMDEVTVTFALDGYSVKDSFGRISEITAKNLPSAYDINFLTTGIYPMLAGKTESLDELTLLDIVLQVDLGSLKTIAEDTYSLPVTVMIAGHPELWAVGDSTRYTVTFSLTEKQVE